MDSIISVSDLSVSFFTKEGEVRAVDGISYDIPRGKILGIVGESGCGKSVSSYAIMGLLENPGRITSGEILFENRDLTKFSEQDYLKIRGRKMAMIFQEPMTALNPVLSIEYQITEQIKEHMGFNKKDARDKGIELLTKVGIPSPEKRIKDFPHQLSGGMKQRAMIAMALSCDPDFLIADEPTTALDVTIQAQILDLLQSIQDETHMTIQFITHDLGVISEVADHVLVMYAGKVVESGTNKEIFENPKHPYTIGLLSSLPSFGSKKEKLYTIPGNVPSPLHLPRGCSFSNRCPNVRKECLKERPTLEKLSEMSELACFYPGLSPTNKGSSHFNS